MDSLPNSKVVDICNKLVSGNTMIQYQALAKVYTLLNEYSNNQVEKKRTVLKLMETFRSIKSKNCCISVLKVLTKLSIDGLIDYDLLVNSFLSLINSKADNYVYCIDFVTELLIHFVDECISKYSIRNPTHPFLDMLRNSNESIDSISESLFNQINLIYDDPRLNLTKSSKLLKPVFTHIFLESQTLKHFVGKFLIEKLTIHPNNQIIDLINLYLKSLKKNDFKDVHLFESISNLIRIVLNNKDLINKIKLCDLINLMIEIDTIENYNFSKQWNLMTNSLRSGDTSLKKEIVKKDLLDLLAANLSKIGFINLESYLIFVDECISAYEGNSKLDLAIFLPNLFLYTMSLGHVESIDTFKIYRVLISNLISKIEQTLRKGLVYEPVNLNDTNLFNLIEYEDNDPLTQDPNERINKNLLNLLSAHFISNEEDLELNKKICTVFKQITVKWPNLYGIIYSLYIYKMRISINCDIIIYLLTSMTDLISSKIDISLCLNILKSLMVSSNGDNLIVRLTCMKQLTKLCTMKYDYLVYPHLSNELISINNLQLAESDRLEVLYMKAYCIHQIILYRPDYYAQELLATISSLLNQCNQKNDQGVCSILIDALGYLCESEVVDMVSTWNALVAQYKTEKRVLTLGSYCRFMSVASKLKYLENENEDSFYSKMLLNLWTLSDPIENSNEYKWKVISSSLKELSSFNKSYFKCSHLPKYIQEKIRERNKKLFDLEENKEKTLNELLPRVPSICFIDLFQSLEPEAYEGCAQLFKSMLTEEIDSIPRRSVSFAKEKVFSQDEQQMAQKNFYDQIKNFLTDEYNQTLNDAEVSQNKLDLAYILYCYDAPADRNLEGKVVKKHVKSYWKSYEQTLSLILQKGNFEFNEEQFNYYTKGFNRFINNSYHACIQALNLEYNSQLDEKHEHVKEVQDKISNIWNIARDKHLKILTESYKDRSNESCNNLFLIVLNSLIETSTGYLCKNLMSDENSVYNHRKWLEVLVDFILNIKENKTASESEYINMFSYKQAHSVDTLKFLYKVYQKSSLINCFLASVLQSCSQIKISAFLIQYIHRIQSELYQKNKLESNKIKSLSIYLKSLMNIENEFQMEHNTKINDLFENLLNKFKTQVDDECHIVDAYMETFVDCLSQLYNEESIYYDDKNILENILDILNQKLKTLVFYELNKSAISTLVNLTCLAYKSNLIKNENLILIYEILNKESRYNSLLALFCRFLLSYGFYDSVEWIEKAFKKWMKYYGDFKLNLNSDIVELDYCLKGILTVLTGVSIDYINFNQNTYLPMDVEKFLKPESTIKDLLKFFKAKKENFGDLNKNLAFTLDHFNRTKFGEIYSTPNSYDYLDDFSLLKHIVNELLRLSKMKQPEVNSSDQFEFYLKVLLDSCLSTKCKILPPLNWYYFMTSLIKSKFGSNLESQLIKLTLMQVNHLNSAYSLIKNYLVDTNYFSFLKSESQMIVFEHFVGILDRFNLTLIRKFINKLKLFLRQKSTNSRHQFNGYILRILSSLFEFLNRKTEGSNDLYREAVNFFVFISKEFNFKLKNDQEVQILNLIASMVEKLNDNELMNYVLNLDDSLPVDERFMMVFYIRTRLILDQAQPFMFLNETIDSVINYYDIMNDETKSTFMNTFAKFLLEISHKENEYSQNQASMAKSNSLKNSSLNWLMEYINKVKLMTKNVEYAIKIFSVIIYCWSNQSIELYDLKTCFINESHVLDNLSVYLRKFVNHPFWKQLNLKLIDWLINILSNNTFSSQVFETLLQSIFVLYKDSNVPDEIWYKYANLVNTKILS